MRTRSRLCSVIALSVVMVATLAMAGCASGTNNDWVTDDGISDVPSGDELDSELRSEDGVPIAKVDGNWMWRSTFGVGRYGQYRSTLIVNLRADGGVVQHQLNCGRLDVLVVGDAVTDDAARVTAGDNQKYAYVVHIPAGDIS